MLEGLKINDYTYTRIYQIVITEILCYETLKVTNKSSECKANGLIYEKWECELISSKSNFFSPYLVQNPLIIIKSVWFHDLPTNFLAQ